MNYYPFHIGDYASATRHLSWEEDLAYRRLLDVYYTSEKPLPSDIRQVYRLILATTKAQREAVEVVLNEFFELSKDGWVSARADAEIASMRDKQIQNEIRDSHETERMKRHRERRAEMFAVLRSVDIVPAWDISMKDLQRLYEENCNVSGDAHVTHLQRTCNVSGDSPETRLQRERNVSCNASATAIPIPTPTPIPVNINTGASAKRDKPAALVKPDGIPDSVWSDFLSIRKAKRAPLTQTALDGIQREAAKAGLDLAAALAMCCARGWQGFKADWVSQPSGASPDRAKKFDPVAFVNGGQKEVSNVIDVTED